MLLPLLLRLMSCSYNILSPAAERVRVSEGERHPQDGGRERRRKEGESYTFNCSFHGGVKDEEEGGENKSGGREDDREGDSMQQVEGFLEGKFCHLYLSWLPGLDTAS